MKLDELTKPGWGDTADYFCERDTNYRTNEMNILAFVNLLINAVADSPVLTKFGDQMESHDTVR